MPPVVGFLGAIVSGITSALSALGLSGLVSFTSLSAFLASPLGSLIVGIGLQLVSMLFVKRPTPPTTEAGKINVRLPEPERWLVGGNNRQGGGVLFAEFDSLGNFWYLIVHADSQLSNPSKRYFDDIEITIDENGNVLTNDFCLNQKREPFVGTGTRVPYFQIWTRTHTLDNPTPPPVTELSDAFPGVWTSDHKLVGTTYSVVKVKAIRTADRYKVFKWRGPVGVGEPSFSIVGVWALPYNPTDVSEYGDPEFHLPTSNSVLLWAWFRMHRYGRNKPFNSINWDRIREQAAICDQDVTGIDGVHKRYRAGISIIESKARYIAEQEILMACDAQLVFDNDGKCWPRVGYYYTPTLTLYRNRDIVAVDSVEAQNGESETQGVIVQYIEPGAKYTSQPCAAWYNPHYYTPGTAAVFLKVEALAIQDHNQAMRLAKSIGMRSQSTHKLLPTVGLRGLKARQERIIDFNYDNTFAGDYEIVTPVEVEPMGIFCGFGIVPIDENRFNLLPGEEKPKPTFVDSYGLSSPPAPADVVVVYSDNRIEATFSAPLREDVSYEFFWSLVDSDEDKDFNAMIVNMNDLIAYSTPVPNDDVYYLRWRSVSSGGKVSPYPDDNYELITIANPNPPLDIVSFNATGGLGNATFTATSDASDANIHRIAVYRVPTGDTLNKGIHQRILIPITAGSTVSTMVGDGTRVNALLNPNCDTDTVWNKNAVWTWDAAGLYVKPGTFGSNLTQPLSLLNVAGRTIRCGYTQSDSAGAGALVRFTAGSGAQVDSPASTVDGVILRTLVTTGNTDFAIRGSGTFTNGKVDKMVAFQHTPACLPQGIFDFHPIPENISGVEGPAYPPITGIVVY